MDLVFDLLQGAGIAAAIGIRPFLPVLLTAVLASGDVAVDFDGTDFAFLEEWWFLLLILAFVAAQDFAVRRGGYDTVRRGVPFAAVLAATLALGALMAAGILADDDEPIVAGVLAGIACAALGFFATRDLLGRVRARLRDDEGAAGALPLYAEGAALLAAAASLLFPPLAVLVIAGLLVLLFGGRRRSREKYAGLRILR